MINRKGAIIKLVIMVAGFVFVMYLLIVMMFADSGLEETMGQKTYFNYMGKIPSLAVGDIDGDNLGDILFIDFDGPYLMKNLGGGKFDNPIFITK
jgi:hypothetical protein